MGADIKKLRNRIKSVDSTLHLTRAMGLVASSKMRRAMEGMQHGREYEAAVRAAIDPLILSEDCRQSPYMQTPEQGMRCLIVIAGDRGLAGGYNANIWRALRELEIDEIIPIGKRACDRYGDGTCYAEQFDYSNAIGLAIELCRSFVEGRYCRVDILHTRYITMLSQEVSLTPVFPLAPVEKHATEGHVASVVFEPDEVSVLEAAMPEYVAGVLMRAVRESFACEIVARRTAMDSAGKNAQEMIDSLQLEYNRARQSAITQEITEIVAGSGS